VVPHVQCGTRGYGVVLGAALGNVAGTAAAALGTGTAEVRGISIEHAPLETTWELPVRRGGRSRLSTEPQLWYRQRKATTDDVNRRATQRDP
jgi:hypothetical protein